MYIKSFVKTIIILGTIIASAFVGSKLGFWPGVLAGFIVAYPIEGILFKIMKKAI